MKIWSQYLEQNKSRFLEELKALLAIPSVSANGNYKSEVRLCATKILLHLKNGGCDNYELAETNGFPIVFGSKMVNPSKLTLLVYGHYDVQPPDPIDLWESGPFEPVVKDEKIFARGASDDKGQLFMHIKALEIMTHTDTLDCNVKFLIEGEEEIGSGSLNNYLIEHQQKLAADIVLVSDTSMISMKNPSIETSLRGLAYMQVELTGPNRDLHSGVYGGAIGNPINILCRMIASLQDENNHITIPGFYDMIAEHTSESRKEINFDPFDLEIYKRELGIKDVWGEKGYTTLERIGIRPSLDVNGIWGGYTGDGAKTVLPSKAYAKISMRLVPNQEPHEIAKQFQNYLMQICPASVTVKVIFLHGGDPVITPTESKGYKAAQSAIMDVFGKKAIPTYSGGSIPVVAQFKKILGLDTVLLGFGLDNDNIHSPNEKFDLFNFYKGIETICYFQKHFSK